VEEGGLRVGFGRVDITPDPVSSTVRLGGYEDRGKKPATGVMAPLHARAMVASDAEGRLVGIASLDVCHVNSGLRDLVVERLAPAGFGDDSLLLAATHTHSGFAGYDRTMLARWLFGAFDAGLLERTAGLVTDALLQAMAAMRPCRLESATREIEGLNRSRLDPAFEFGDSAPGRGVAPDPARYPVDKRLSVIKAVGPDGRACGAIVHFAAHPTILSPKNLNLSPDFPGIVCGRVEEAMGSGSVALYLNGTLGDTAPTPDWTDTVEAEIADLKGYGNRLADEACGLLTETVAAPRPCLEWGMARREFANAVLRPLRRLRLPRMLSRALYLRPDVPLQVVRLGGTVLVAVPGEATFAAGGILERLCPAGIECLVVAPANGYVGYLVTPSQYADGGYAADSCLFGPDVVARLEEGFREAFGGIGSERPAKTGVGDPPPALDPSASRSQNVRGPPEAQWRSRRTASSSPSGSRGRRRSGAT
jgi:hypothetical protein